MTTLYAEPSADAAQEEQARLYWQQGYIALRGLFSPEEVAAWQQECDRLLRQDWINPNNIRTPFRMNSTQTPERIDPVVDVSPGFAALVEDERILAPLRAIFNDAPRLFKDKLIFKMPGVEGYQMHQDYAWGWQDLCDADDILSVSIQVDGADDANGCIELFPDYHRELLTPPGLQTNLRAEEIARVDAARGQKIETRPGDVLIFHALAPHQSGRNTAQVSRRSLYLTYNAAQAGNLKEQYYENYRERVSKGGGDLFFQ